MGDFLRDDFPPDERFTLRGATLEDIEDIATVAQQGFPDDPEFDYRFPKRNEFPEDNRKWIVQEYREYLEQPNKYAVVIITASDNDDRAVALSVWDMAIHTRHKGGDLGVPDDPQRPPRRRDVNADHFRQFSITMAAGFARFFGSHGNAQVHLWLLATHPDFRRRGAATRLCQWGLDQAALRGPVCTTVLASQMGKALYTELGFSLDGSFIVRVDDEPEELCIWALTHAEEDAPGRTSSEVQGVLSSVS